MLHQLINTRKAQTITICTSGLGPPTIFYGKPALMYKPHEYRSCSSHFRGPNSRCNEQYVLHSLQNAVAKIQHLFETAKRF